MDPSELELRALNQAGRVCPYCKDLLGAVELIECPNCKTRMHRECFGENRGCTSLGCGVQSQTWPCCPRCQVRLARQSSIVCLHCGLNIESGETYRRAPSGIYWVMPRWTRYTESGRRRLARVPTRREKVLRAASIIIGAGLFILPLWVVDADANSGGLSLFALFPAWVFLVWLYQRRGRPDGRG